MPVEQCGYGYVAAPACWLAGMLVGSGLGGRGILPTLPAAGCGRRQYLAALGAPTRSSQPLRPAVRFLAGNVWSFFVTQHRQDQDLLMEECKKFK